MTLERCLAEFDWSEKAALQGKLIDGRYHGIARRLLPRRRRVRPEGERAARARSRRHGLGLCRLLLDRPGARDGVRADRRRRARNADGRHQGRVPRLDRPRARRLRLLQLALGGDGRLRDRGGGGEAARGDLRRGGRAAGLRGGRDRDRCRHGARSATDDRCRSAVSRGSRRKPPMPATSAPTATARMPRMSRSIPRPATSSSSTTWRSRTSAASSIRSPCTARRSARSCRVSAARSWSISSTTQDGQLLTGSFADYLLPTASDFPNIRAVALEEQALAQQSARRQGRGRRRHHPGRRRDRQCGGGGARLARRAAARAAAVAAARVAADQPAPLIGDRHGAFDDAAGRAVHALEHSLNCISAHIVDVEAGFFRIGEKLRILQGALERRP